jgi:hypothetical protein
VAVTSVHLDDYMSKHGPLKGYTTSGNTGSVASPTLSAQELLEFIRVAQATKHEVSLVAGVLTVKPG